MVRRRCLIRGCPDHGLWMEAPSERAADLAQRRHYLTEHFEPLPLTDPRRNQQPEETP